jgi:hypothetical protein
MALIGVLPAGWPGPAVETKVLQAAEALLALGLTLYLLVTLRDLLHARFAFRGADGPIAALIWLTVAGVGANHAAEAAHWALLGSTYEPASRASHALAGLRWALVTGAALVKLAADVMGLVLARRLLRLRADLFGLRDPLGYTLQAVYGVWVLTFPLYRFDALLPLANGLVRLTVLGGIGADVMLALVFFRAAATAPARA